MNIANLILQIPGFGSNGGGSGLDIQTIKEAVPRIANSVKEVCRRVERVLKEKTKPSDTVLIVGVGNTIGVE